MKSKPTYQELEKEIENLHKEKAEVSNDIKKKILNSINDGIYINSPDYTIEYLNEPMIKMLGGDKTGQKCYKSIYNMDKICEWCIFENLKRDDTITHELKHPSTNKTYIIKNLLLDNGSKVTSYHDISELKKNEFQLQKRNNEITFLNEEYKTTNKQLLISKENAEASEEYFKTVFNNSFDGLIIHNNKKIISVNNKFLQMRKVKRENIENKPIPELLSNFNYSTEIKKNILKEEISYEFDLTKKPNEPKVFVEITSKKLTDKKKNICKLVSIRDISDRKKAEQSLIETKNELILANKNLIEQQSIFMVGNVVIFKWQNKEGWPVEYVSENVENIFGFNQEEFISGKVNFSNLINKDDIEKVSEEIIHAINNNLNSFEHSEYRITNKHREEVWLYDFTTIIRNGRNEVTHFFGYVMNVTDRKKAELGFRKLSEVAKQSSASIVITDTSGKIEFANPFFTKITGYTLEEAKGQNPRILKSKHTTKEEYKELWDTISSGKTWQGEFLNIKKNKEKYWEKAIISPITNDSGKIINYVAIKEDITEQKKAGQALKKSEAELRESNQTKDKFFSIIAHDLINPFNTILGFSNILLENHKKYDAEEREEMIKYLNKSANNAFKLLENLLAWSRSQSGVIKYSPEKLNLKILLSETMLNLQGEADRKNIYILDDISENELIFADKNMITTVLRNLISNAIKFTNIGGSIIISSKKQTNSNFLEISVEDTGVGIPKDRIDDLFRIDKNTSTQGTENETGTGLGLILCKEFVKKHGSKIWAESEIGKGSKFIITMPNIYN